MPTLTAHQTQGFGGAFSSKSVVRYNYRGLFTKASISQVSCCKHGRVSASSKAVIRLKIGFSALSIKRNDATKIRSKGHFYFPISSARSEAEEVKDHTPRSSGYSCWLINLRNQIAIKWPKSVLQKPQFQLKLPEKDEIIRKLQEIQWQQSVIKLWQDTPTWIKWPLAICVPCFSAATRRFGFTVTRELLPLWIFTTLLTGMAMKYCYLGVLFFKKVLFDSIATLFLGVRQYFEEKLTQLQYFKANWKKILKVKSHELGEKIVDAYWDFIERRMWRQYRAISRFIKGVFLA